jgi:hypothetical protein
MMVFGLQPPGALRAEEIVVSRDDRYAGNETIAEPIREKRRDTPADSFVGVLKFQKRAYIAERLSPARFQVRQPLAGFDGAMEDLTVVAPDQDRLSVWPRLVFPAFVGGKRGITLHGTRREVVHGDAGMEAERQMRPVLNRNIGETADRQYRTVGRVESVRQRAFEPRRSMASRPSLQGSVRRMKSASRLP